MRLSIWEVTEQKYLIMHQSIPSTHSLCNTLGNKPFYSEFGVCIFASQPFLLIKLNNNFKDILNRALSNLKYFNENEGLCVSGDSRGMSCHITGNAYSDTKGGMCMTCHLPLPEYKNLSYVV